MYVKLLNGRPVEVAETLTAEQHQDRTWTARWDWKTFEMVQTIASYATAMTGTSYLPIDNGTSVSPRYDIMKCPKVGDKVSYGFNGDYYPDGEIVKISPKLMITTSTGNTYRRRGSTSSWTQPGGTWGLVAGHVDERNPSF